MVDVPLSGPGIWVDDEVLHSGDPPKHAADLCANAARNGFKWVCCAMQGIPPETLELVRVAAQRAGVWYGTWAQGLAPAVELDRLRRDGHGAFHMVNIESRGEEHAWSDQQLDQLVSLMTPIGVGVIFTQAAYDGAPSVPDPKLAKRWIDRGFSAHPEANLAENAPGASVSNMAQLAELLGWPSWTISPVCYIIDKPNGQPTPVSTYSADVIHAGDGHWSLYRYGNIKQADWLELLAWPKNVPSDPNVPPVPPPPGPVTPPPVSATAARELMTKIAEYAIPANAPAAFWRSRIGLAYRVLRAKDDPFLKVNTALAAWMKDRGL